MREEKIERFSNYQTVKKSHFYYLVYIPLFKALQSSIDKYAKGTLLDIGCGNKPYEKMLEHKIDKYVGCDIIQSSDNRVDVLCPANKIPLEDQTFDTVFSTQTIEHVEDHQGLVNEAYRLLKKDGHFIVSGPMYWNLHEEPYDFFRFTKYGFEYILKKAGFEVVEILPNGGAWATLGQAIIHTCTFPNPKNGWLMKGFKYCFVKFKLVFMVNLIFHWLDKKDFNPINTMNYVAVAKK